MGRSTAEGGPSRSSPDRRASSVGRTVRSSARSIIPVPRRGPPATIRRATTDGRVTGGPEAPDLRSESSGADWWTPMVRVGSKRLAAGHQPLARNYLDPPRHRHRRCAATWLRTSRVARWPPSCSGPSGRRGRRGGVGRGGTLRGGPCLGTGHTAVSERAIRPYPVRVPVASVLPRPRRAKARTRPQSRSGLTSTLHRTVRRTVRIVRSGVR